MSLPETRSAHTVPEMLDDDELRFLRGLRKLESPA